LQSEQERDGKEGEQAPPAAILREPEFVASQHERKHHRQLFGFVSQPKGEKRENVLALHIAKDGEQ
jgi:hypothetical protein